MAQESFRQSEIVLYLANAIRLQFRFHPHVVPFLVSTNGICQPALPPRISLRDFSALAIDDGLYPLNHGVQALIIQFRLYYEDQFVVAQWPTSFPWDCAECCRPQALEPVTQGEKAPAPVGFGHVNIGDLAALHYTIIDPLLQMRACGALDVIHHIVLDKSRQASAEIISMPSPPGQPDCSPAS